MYAVRKYARFYGQAGKFQALLAVALFMFKIEFWVKHAHQ